MAMTSLSLFGTLDTGPDALLVRSSIRIPFCAASIGKRKHTVKVINRAEAPITAIPKRCRKNRLNIYFEI
jgi:hypothetical protein